jgi:hypothetical protein
MAAPTAAADKLSYTSLLNQMGIETYQIKPGDTLSAVASSYHLTLGDLLSDNQHITDPNLVQAGERINIPASANASASASPMAGEFDGNVPAPETTLADSSVLIFPPVTSSEDNRSAALYDQVINQFAVGHNPRYLPRDNCTFCNIFVWDVTRAMGCPIPHWVMVDGTIAEPKQPGALEINIDAGYEWMLSHGIKTYGWQPADAATAQQYANEGKPAVAIWDNPTGHGHTVIVRPGSIERDKGPTIAQAGGHNFNIGQLVNGFGNIHPIPFFVHA